MIAPEEIEAGVSRLAPYVLLFLGDRAASYGDVRRPPAILGLTHTVNCT